MNMEIKEIILRAVNIIIFPIYILIFINLYKFKKNVFILLNILFNITCMLNSMIFFLPKGETGNLACLGQAFLFVFGDLSKLALATGFIVVAFYSFLNPSAIEEHKILYFIITLIVCQIFPVFYGIFSVFIAKPEPFPLFCYVSEAKIITITYVLRYLFIFLFYIASITFIVYFRRTFSEQKDEEFYINYKNKMIRYIILVSLSFFVSLAYNVLDAVSGLQLDLTNYYGVVYVIDGVLIPCYAIIFLLDSNRISEMKDLLCCCAKSRETIVSSDEYQLEIV